MSNLEKINELLQDAIHEHAAIRALSKTTHIKTAAKKLAELTAEIEILKDQKAREIERIEAKKREDRNRQRQEYLKRLAANTETAIAKSNRLANTINELAFNLVEALAERESVFSASAIGLYLPERNELLSNEEQKSLFSTLERSLHSVSRGEFAVSWQKAVERVCKGDNKARRALLRLVEPLSDHHTTAIAGGSSFLLDEIRRLPKDFPDKLKPEKVSPEPKDNATRIVADLRPLAKKTS